jgi:hypothetical protein
MATVIFGLSFQTEAEVLPPHQRYSITESDADGVLPGMTAIFRLAFRSMLSEVRVFEPPRKVARTPAGSIKIRHCSSFRACTIDIHGRGTPDFLLVVVLELSPNARAGDAAKAWQSFRSIQSKVALLKRCGLNQVVHSYSTAAGKIVGQNSFVMPDGLESDPKPLSSIFAFYFLAWLTSLRIERSQLRTELTIGRKALASSGWRIANQRLRILNLSRYFLTKDRTNDATLKAVCDALSAKFKLQARYERAVSLHREFEHHFDNTSKIVQSQQLGSVSNLLLILTLLSVPISFFGAIIAINLQSDIFRAPIRVLSDYRIYLIFVIGLGASLVPFIALKIHDRLRGKR